MSDELEKAGDDLAIVTGREVEVDNRSRNLALVSYWALPSIFLTVALLGGLRVGADDRAFIFFPPPLITLVLAVLLMLLFVRGGLIELRTWVAASHSPLQNISHIWVLLTLFFASAQAFNSVLPERGLLHWLFSFFFLWTLWNNQFSSFDARRLLRSLVVLFGTAFVLKHLAVGRSLFFRRWLAPARDRSSGAGSLARHPRGADVCPRHGLHFVLHAGAVHRGAASLNEQTANGKQRTDGREFRTLNLCRLFAVYCLLFTVCCITVGECRRARCPNHR